MVNDEYIYNLEWIYLFLQTTKNIETWWKCSFGYVLNYSLLVAFENLYSII